MKIYFFLPILFTCLTCSLPAQNTFQKIYGDTAGAGVSAVTGKMTGDGGYIIFGSSNYHSAGSADFYTIKTNPSGDILWTKIYGGVLFDPVSDGEQTSDGGYIIAGQTTSFGTTLNIYLVKTDSGGNVIWSKAFDATNSDNIESVHQTNDHGYILAGSTDNISSGNTDFYLIKTDSTGNLQWTKIIDGFNFEAAYSVIQTSDGGFIITGTTSNLPSVSYNIFLIKTDASGNIQWTRSIGGIANDYSRCVRQTTDSGFIISGWTNSFGTGNHDAYLIKTDGSGNLQWSKVFGGANNDEARSVAQTTDGGFIVAGNTYSFGAGDNDVLLFKTDNNGNLLWARTFGGTDYDIATSVIENVDGSFAVIATTNSFSLGDMAYLIKTDSSGNSGCNESTPLMTTTTPSTVDSIIVPAIISGGTANTASTIVNSGGTAVTLCSLGGINNELDKFNMTNIFPNPSIGNFTITFGDLIDKGRVEIYNALGERLFSEPVNKASKQEINLKNISGGIYFVKVFEGDKSYCKKLIVE